MTTTKNDNAVCQGKGCPMRDTCGRAAAYDLPFEFSEHVAESFTPAGFCPNYIKLGTGQLTLRL